MKILYVTTISDTVNAFLVPHIRMLVDHGHQVDVACRVESEPDAALDELGCRVHELPFRRRVLSGDNVAALRQLKGLIRAGGYGLVHTHTPVASACARLACRGLTGVRVFYTAHGFHFSRGSSFLSWLAFFPAEWWLSRMTDVLITINREDHARARRLLRAGRTCYLPGVGIDTAGAVSEPEAGRLKRQELGLPTDALVLLSVGELNANKNHGAALRALARLGRPDAHYVICGAGPLAARLARQVAELGLAGNVHLLGYRTDVREIYAAADIFVFPSRREGLPVALMEAMAAALPVVASDIRGVRDLIMSGAGGELVASGDVEALAAALGRMASAPEFRRAAGRCNIERIAAFDLERVLTELAAVYRAEIVSA